jgi:DNA-directed RNA polymerase subunit RPC12/RpoP
MIKFLDMHYKCPKCGTQVDIHSQKEIFNVIKSDTIKCNKCNTEFGILSPEYTGINPHNETEEM